MDPFNQDLFASALLGGMQNSYFFRGLRSYGPTVLKQNRTAAIGGGNTQAADWDRAKARSLVGGVRTALGAAQPNLEARLAHHPPPSRPRPRAAGR